MNKIQPLPADVRACVRTGVTLTSFAQAVEELVLNSIDAGASSVAVRVDLTCFRIQVVDNGRGISFDQFQLIGERYSTSKCHTLEDLENLKYFGYRGEALASLRTSASFLEIVSRSKSSVMTHSKCFQNSVALGVVQASLPRPSAGTTVTAHDLFYNLPVRRKRVNSVLEMEKIRYRLAGIALIWPCISFSLRDDSAGHVILQTYKCSGMATSFSYIFTPARARGLMEVAAERDEFKLTGLVSRESYSRMDLQFVFINKRLVLKTSIHRQINKILSRSLILRRKGFTSEMLEKNVNTDASSTSSPQKQSERYAVFVVNVECPYSAYDITFDPSKTLVEFQNWPKLIHLLQDMLYGFLRKENLISITQPVSSTSPCDVNDDDEIDEEENDDSCQNNSNSENGLSNEKEDARINLSLGAVHKSGKNISFLDNGLFSKTVHRPKHQIKVNAIVLEEQTKSMTKTCGECQESSLSEQLPLNASSGETVVFNVDQQNSGRHSSILNTSYSDNTGCTQQKSFQTCSKPDNFLTSQEENKTNTKLFHQQNVPSISHCHNGNQSSLLYQHNCEKEIIVKPCLQATKHSLCEDSEEVIIKKPALSKRSEITLGTSVQYSSTLKSLRDMNQMSSSNKVSEIITDTLQLLRCAAQKSVKNLGNLYKTPQKLTVSNDGGLLTTSHSRVEKDEITTMNELTTRCISNTYTRIQNNELRASIPHKNNLIQASSNQFYAENVAVLDNSISRSSRSRSSFNFRSTKEDRSLGESDRGNGQKRPSYYNTSHASKLAKLMRGKSTDDNQEMCDNDSDGTDSMKYTKILNAFNYNKQQKNVHFKHGDTKKGSHCVPSGSIKYCDQASDTSFSGDSLAWCTDIASQHLVREKGTAGGTGKGRWDLSVSSSSNTKQLCSKAACNKCCCCLTTRQSRGQLSHVADSLPFSMYEVDDTVENAEVENSSPKVSVILSLPLDDSKSNSSPVENLKQIEKDKLALLSNQNRNIHSVSSDPGHSFVGENVNGSRSTVVMPFHNHTMVYNKNKDTIMQSMMKHSKQSPDQSLPKTSDNLVEDQLNIISQSETEAGSCGSNASTPQMSQGFTVTTTQLDRDDSGSLSDDVSSVGRLQCKNSANSNVESPNGCASSGFSPASEVSSSSLERSSPWIQPDYKASVDCIQSNITDDTGASVNYVILSDSDTEIYIQNANNTEPTHTLPDYLYCEETQSSQETDLDAHLEKDPEVTSVNCSSGPVLTSSAVPKIANTNIDNVVENTQEEHVSLPVTVCSTTPEIEEYQPNEKSISQACHSPDPSTIQDTDGVESIEQDSISDNMPNTGLQLVDDISHNGDKENVLINEYREDKNDFSEITNMISDAKQMFKNMREFLGASVPTQDPFTHSCNIRKESVTTSHHRHTCRDSSSSAKFLESFGSTACDNLAGPEVHSSKTSIENHLIDCEQRPVPEAVEKDTFQSSLRSGLHRDSETCSKRDRSGNISDLNTLFLPIEVIRSDKSYQESEHTVCHDSCVSLKDGINLSSEQPCRSSLSLRFQISPTVSNNHSEETLGHNFSCVHEKDTAQIPNLLYPEASSDNYDSESGTEFEKVKCKYTQVQNPCKSSSLLDGEDNLQIEKPSCLLNMRHTYSETDQAEVMSSEGDKLLMMIHDSVSIPGKIPDKCENSSRGNSLTRSECLSPEKESCLSKSDDMSVDKVPSEIGQSTVTVETVNTNDAMLDNRGVAETLRYQTPGSEIGLSHFDELISNRSDTQGNLQSVLLPSSLSLIRPDGQTEGSSKKLQPEGHLHRGDVYSANTGTDFEVVLSASDQKPLSVTQVTSNADNAAEQDIQMEAASSSKDDNIVEIESHHNKTDRECQQEIPETACWKEVVDSETGMRTFVSNLSGHTVSEEQWKQLSSQTQKEMLGIHSECVAVPAVSGPAVFSASEKQAFSDFITNHFEQEENEALSKWKKGERPVYDKSAEADISALMAKWTNPVFLNYKQPGLLADSCPSEAVSRSCFNSLSSVEFTKGILDKVKVVGQLDNKFIVSMIDNPESCSKATRPKCSSLLVLFDQHAVHERIRLEHFTKECYEVEGGERTDRIKRAEIKPAQSITMDQDDLRIMKAFSNEFNRIGIDFSVDKISRNTIHISSFPVCLMEKDASELKKNKITSVIETVENLIKEHIELLKSTNGACGRLPLTIHKVLCSQACHGAVKFGDKLTVQECQDLLSSLAFCNLPFQCAHGRPSLAPLVNLDAVERELLSVRRPPNLWKISQNIKQ